MAILPGSQSQRTGLGYFSEVKSLSYVQLFATSWAVTQLCPTPAKLLRPWNFPGKNTGIGCYFLLQGNLPNPGIKPSCPTLWANSLLSEPPEKPGLLYIMVSIPVWGGQSSKELRLKCLNPTQNQSCWRPWGHPTPAWGSHEVNLPLPAQGPNSWEADIP